MKQAKDPCSSCGSRTYTFYRGVASVEGVYYSVCSDCSKSAKAPWIPDVYFDASKGPNQTDPNLCDRYKGKIPFSSKREKAVILRQKGIREVGDKVHGARNFDKTSSKQWEGM